MLIYIYIYINYNNETIYFSDKIYLVLINFLYCYYNNIK